MLFNGPVAEAFPLRLVGSAECGRGSPATRDAVQSPRKKAAGVAPRDARLEGIGYFLWGRFLPEEAGTMAGVGKVTLIEMRPSRRSLGGVSTMEGERLSGFKLAAGGAPGPPRNISRNFTGVPLQSSGREP